MPIRIESLISDEAPLRPDMRAGSVIERFLADSACSALPVVFQRTVLGVALRDRLLELALRIGREAFDDLPLKRIVDPNPVIAESGTPIGQVARMVADAGGKGFRQGVLVTHGGAYYGYVPPAALTRELTAENTRRAHQLKLAARKIEGLRSAEALFAAVNAVTPGYIRTAQALSEKHSLGPEGLEKAAEFIPMGRVGEPEDIADVILFLVSDQARYLTGQVLTVDGGLLVGRY